MNNRKSTARGEKSRRRRKKRQYTEAKGKTVNERMEGRDELNERERQEPLG